METTNGVKMLQANIKKFPTYIEEVVEGIPYLKLYYNNHKILIPLCSQEKVKVTAEVEYDKSGDTISRSLYQILFDERIFIQFSLKPGSDINLPNHKRYLEFAMLLTPNISTRFTAVEK